MKGGMHGMSPFSLGHSLPSDRGVCPFVWDANGEKVPALMCRKYSMQTVKSLPAVVRVAITAE